MTDRPDQDDAPKNDETTDAADPAPASTEASTEASASAEDAAAPAPAQASEAASKPDGASESASSAEASDAASSESAEASDAASSESAEASEAAPSAEASEAAPSDAATSDGPPAAPVVAAPPTPPRKRRPLEWARAIGLTTVGLGGLFAQMAILGQLPRGPMLGIFLAAIGVIGLIDLLGLFQLAERAGDAAPPVRRTWLGPIDDEPAYFAPLLALPTALFVALIGAFQPSWSALPYFLFAALAVLVPPATRRPGLAVFVVGVGIMLPFLGAYGLWDPWETHYGEVAREILTRDDWISLWWAHEEWFFSKPIWIFWSEALSMGALGVDFHPDANPAHPEWAIRFPHFLLAASALLCVFAFVRRSFGGRAGMIAALVVATTPHYFMLSHQAITDMPFVSTMTMAMCMLGLAIAEDPQTEVRGVRVGPFTVNGQQAVLFLIALFALPQAIYLLSRNVNLVSGGFAWHRDSFMFGSGGGNAGHPGQPAARAVEPAVAAIGAQPAMQAVYWLLGFAVIAYFIRRERRVQSLYMFAFYFFCALSFMAKGIPGFALPGLVALFFLIGSRRWDLLLGGHLRVGIGMLIVAVVGMPWYVAMYMRHGQAFTDRLLIHDHINRLTAGVHGDTGSAEYFFEQLGFGLFPWIGFAPIAVAGWTLLRRGAGTEDELRRRETAMLIGLWGTSAFVLFSAMTTKFHHYIFPAVPPAAILVGIAMTPFFDGVTSDRRRAIAGTALAIFSPLPLVLGIGGAFGDLRGVAPLDLAPEAMRLWGAAHPLSSGLSIVLVLVGVGLAAGAFQLLRRRGDEPASSEVPVAAIPMRHGAATVGLFSAAALAGIVGRDLSWATESHPFGYERLIHLFVYNYQRPWPDQFDYRPILTGFTIVLTASIALAAFPLARQVASRALMGGAVFFAMWCLDIYLVDLAPHWGQRELFETYYERRSGPEEKISAWQMNWKGENFYTGNACNIFGIDLDNRPLQNWVREHQGERHFFVLEHSRVGSLRSVLAGSEVTEETDLVLNNKFILVSAIFGRSGEAARQWRAEHNVPQPPEERLR